MIVGIVVFHEGRDFSLRLGSIVKNGATVYIFDNSPQSEYSRSYLIECESKNIKYVTAGKNVGLAVAMTILCAQAYYEGHKTLFFLDQDTVISNEAIDLFQDLVAKLDLTKYSALSISNDALIASSNLNAAERYIVKDVKLIRNSGTLFNLVNLMTMNWFDVKYFVDGIDYDFSLNSRINGFALGLIENFPGFDHLSAQGYSDFFFFGLKFHHRKYNFSRCLDVATSSLKLILKSIFAGKFDYSYLFTRHLVIFMLTQFVLRISRKSK